MEKLKMEKLNIPGLVCPICNKRLIKTSHVAIVDRNTIIHFGAKCFITYIAKTQEHLPEKKRDRVSKYDYLYYFTANYEKSNKAITEAEYINYQKQFTNVFLMLEPVALRKQIRDRIWGFVGRKLAKNLQYLHALNKIYNDNKERWRPNGFQPTFISSVSNQFKTKGYLSKKQWQLVQDLVERNIKQEDRHYLYTSLSDSDDIANLMLPDKLRWLQSRKSFYAMYNREHGIPEEE
ncbi:MAG: hypothetical protein WC495_07105 [Patescibacteria group bacterium]|jgi:hypothetical protein